MINYLYWSFFLIGMVLVYFSIRAYNNTKNLIQNGIQTTAKVIDLKEVSDDDGYTYKPVFQYKNRNQDLQEFTGKVSSRPPAYRIGEKVKIVYDPKDNNEVKTVTFWGLYRWTVILLCIAAPLLIIGGGYLIYMGR